MPDDCASEVDDEELYDECIYNFVKQSINGSSLRQSVKFINSTTDTVILIIGLIFCVVAVGLAIWLCKL